LKQARHRAFASLLEGRREVIAAQYLQTSFSALYPVRDDRGGRCGAFVVFAARAAFGAAPMAF
jgi:hypothetical protein